MSITNRYVLDVSRRILANPLRSHSVRWYWSYNRIKLCPRQAGEFIFHSKVFDLSLMDEPDDWDPIREELEDNVRTVTWTNRVNEYITSASKVAGTSLAVEDWANQSVAESLITNFEEACGDGCSSDSRSGMRWAVYMQAP